MKIYLITISFILLVLMSISVYFKVLKNRAYLAQEKIIELKNAQKDTDEKVKKAKKEVGDELQDFKSVVDTLFD